MTTITDRVKEEMWVEFKSNCQQQVARGYRLITATYSLASALALEFVRDQKSYWFPKSLISTLVDPDEKVYYYAPTWLLKQKGLL